MSQSALRALPSADRLLRCSQVTQLLERYAREPVVYLVREVLQEWRARIVSGDSPPSMVVLAEQVVDRAGREWVVRPRSVINATGVVLHTNLGRAPVSQDALAAMAGVGGYSDLEYDLSTGKRGTRHESVERLLLSLTPAEAAHVTVNNAAAVTLALAGLAKGKEVIVSRGQAVEIGGGFRVPVILRQSGARLVEVGTTNRTRISDYEDAISPRTAAILHVHTSNFRVIGFTEDVELADLANLAHRRGLILIDDNGSGSLLDTAKFGLAHEPTPIGSLQAGCDVVSFSGDKLLGGPQAGILLGRAPIIQRLRSHPLSRAMRPDKITIAALSATLLAYVRGDAETTLPVWQMISQTVDQIGQRAAVWQSRAADHGIPTELQNGESTVGGGSLPGETLSTVLIRLPRSVHAAALRDASPPVIGITRGDTVALDLRTVLPTEEDALLAAVAQVVSDGVVDSATK